MGRVKNTLGFGLAGGASPSNASGPVIGGVNPPAGAIASLNASELVDASDFDSPFGKKALEGMGAGWPGLLDQLLSG